MHKLLKCAGPAALAALVASSGIALAQTTPPAGSSAAPSATAPTQKNVGAKPATAVSPGKTEAEDRGRDVSLMVKKVQEALNAAGEQLKADGIMGPKTAAAIRNFQAGHGLPATGRLDKATRSALKL